MKLGGMEHSTYIVAGSSVLIISMGGMNPQAVTTVRTRETPQSTSYVREEGIKCSNVSGRLFPANSHHLFVANHSSIKEPRVVIKVIDKSEFADKAFDYFFGRQVFSSSIKLRFSLCP